MHDSIIPSFQYSSTPPNFWHTEPATGVDPRLAKARSTFAHQHIYYHGVTGQALGMIRRILHEAYLTAWFSCGEIKRKRHYSLRAAKNFIERQFTRTVPHSASFN